MEAAAAARARTRRRTTVGAAVLAAALALAPAARAQDPASLEGTILEGFLTSASTNCQPNGFGTAQFTAAGTARETYEGTFVESATMAFATGQPIAFDAAFSITASDGTSVEGTKTLQFAASTTNCLSAFDTDVVATYDALLTAPDGRVFHDVGRSEVLIDAPTQRFIQVFSNSILFEEVSYSSPAVVESLTVSPSVITFSIIKPARVELTVHRRDARRRFRRVGSFTQLARRGRNRVTLPRKMAGRRLHRGVYRLTVRARLGRLSGPAARRVFRLR
jgi:hypothetical protein